MRKCTGKDTRIKAKAIRVVVLVGWSVAGIILLILIQAIADSRELQKLRLYSFGRMFSFLALSLALWLV